MPDTYAPKAENHAPNQPDKVINKKAWDSYLHSPDILSENNPELFFAILIYLCLGAKRGYTGNHQSSETQTMKDQVKDIKYIRHDSLLAWGQTCLEKLGVPDNDAHFLSESLIQTSLWGIDSHGIARLPHYLARLQAASIKPAPNIKIENAGPCIANIDGDHGLGIVVTGRATKEAIRLAKKNGVGIAGIRESSHCGAIGIYGRMIANEGLIGIVFTHTDSLAAPHRGYQKFLGTNPICISVPNADGLPVCLDMATTIIPYNAVLNARRENGKIPEGVAFDKEGAPTEDPHSVASLAPVGMHKGYALSFMIDLLCGPLNGMAWGPNISNMYRDLTERRHLGSLVIAIDPQRFFGGTTFPRSAAEMAREAREQTPRDPGQPVLAPGDDHYANEKLRLAHGIPIEPGLWEQMNELSIKFGAALPESVDGAAN
ncbi:MAG: Ldh family oxidoreductase [Imperialibacter sp.]|uniref:Ldh family oxidoreductase n=1 Tax=Imperialibacter sp. TaxID=2038411 RepID=UPI0032EF81A4